MKINIYRKPENCNHCIYRENVSRYLDLDDYCSRTMKRTGKINIDIDCPLRKSKVRKYTRKIFNSLQNRRKAEYKTEDLIQMNMDISLTDKDGKFMEIKTPEPECIIDPTEVRPKWCPVRKDV